MLKNCHFARGAFPVCVLKLLTSKFLKIVDIKWCQILIPICAKKTKIPNVNYVLLICVRWQHRWATQAATQLKDRRHPASPHQVSFSVTFFIPHFGWVIRFLQSSFSSHSSYLFRKPVLCKLPLRIWTIRLRATIWRHWQVWWNPLLLLSDLRLTPFWSTCKTWLWKFLLRKHGWSTTSVDMIILMTHRLDASLFTFPMVITAFFSAMMGGLLAPLVVNVAARLIEKHLML